MIKRRGFLLVFLACLTMIGGTYSLRVNADDWNQWKGNLRDNKSSQTGFNTNWKANPPKLVKTVNGLGIGFSNLCFVGEKIYTLGDFDDRTFLLALDRHSLEILWKTDLGPGGRVNGYVGPKTTPASDGKIVCGLNQKGILFCADADKGNIIWMKSLYDDFEGQIMQRGTKGDPNWGYADSPLLDEGRLVCIPGGKKGSILALNANDGSTLWRTTDFTDNAAYASIIPMQLQGKKFYLAMTESNFVGIDPETGKVLWQHTFSGNPSLCCDPVWDGDRVAYSYATKVGFFGCRILSEGGQITAEKSYSIEEMGNKHHGMIAYNGNVYTTTDRGGFLCFDLSTGEIKWKNRALRDSCVLTMFEGHLILRQENTGDLTLVEASPEQYIDKGTIPQPNRSNHHAWTYPIVLDGQLFIRDQEHLFQYDLK